MEIKKFVINTDFEKINCIMIEQKIYVGLSSYLSQLDKLKEIIDLGSKYVKQTQQKQSLYEKAQYVSDN